jgi:hypothetical protein
MISWLAGAIVSAILITRDFGYFTYLIAMLVPGVLVGLGMGLTWRKFINQENP